MHSHMLAHKYANKCMWLSDYGIKGILKCQQSKI